MSDPRHHALIEAATSIAAVIPQDDLVQLFDRPLVILSAPRSGSTLLFETLRCSESLWSLGTESHFIFNAFDALHPAKRGYVSGALDESDAAPELLHLLRACFLLLVRDSKGRRWLDVPQDERPERIRLLEKTPRNALNVPFMRALFPDMRAVFLHRAPHETISSIIEAWEVGLSRGGFVTFPDLPGWDRRHWCLLLPVGWQALNGCSLAEIAAFQWQAANQAILDGVRKMPSTHWMATDYRALVTDSAETFRKIARFADFPLDAALTARAERALPHSSTTLSAPRPDKWKRHSALIEPLEPRFQRLAETLTGL